MNLNEELKHLRHPTKFTQVFRKKVEVCTDPQRRCYNGVFFSSEMQWTAWGDISYSTKKEDAEESIKLYASINPNSEYAVLDPLEATP